MLHIFCAGYVWICAGWMHGFCLLQSVALNGFRHRLYAAKSPCEFRNRVFFRPLLFAGQLSYFRGNYFLNVAIFLGIGQKVMSSFGCYKFNI